MNTKKILRASYIAILTMSLSSTLVNAQEPLFVSDDDDDIANIGVEFAPLSDDEILLNVLPDDDDETIANIGVDMETSSHSHASTLFLEYEDDDEAIVNIGAS